MRAIIQTAPIDSGKLRLAVYVKMNRSPNTVLSIAKSLDDERKDGHIRRPLHGIPIIVKFVLSIDVQDLA